ncbi:Purine-cytosine permease [Haloechinothrix alba]|uniref:Purine-cytosine permease n=1 Tax=Haloechinothrix alba TaxID=664784 RepID=A0A238Y2F6_9PSEU|nr:hypothetical protein [Haloechinothrix alba]SNR65466.1 Purine-cytosine permease [Haloechinothrix alba]
MSTDVPRVPPLEVTHADDPQVVREAATEDYTAHVVPREWRLPPRSLFGAWWALGTAMFWVILAALVTLTVGTRDAIIGMVLAVVVYGAVNYVLSVYAARTGTTVSLFSRSLFGSSGAVFAPLTIAAIAIWFAVFEGSVIAVAFEHYFGGLDLSLWYLVVVLYSIPLAIGGIRAFLDKFNRFLFPFYVLGLVAVVVWTVVELDASSGWLTYQPEMPSVAGPGWLFAFGVYMGDWVLMMATWDFARFGRTSRRDVRTNGWFTFGPGFYLFTIVVNGLIGIFVALTIPTEGPLSEISSVIGIVELMGIWGLLFVWISQTRINTANFYLATSNLANVFAQTFKLKLPRVAWVVIVGAIVYVIMLSDVFSYLLIALRYTSVLCVTWTACALVFVLRHKVRDRATRPEWRSGRVAAVNWQSLLAWGLGTGVGMLMIGIDEQTSWSATLALPVAFVVSAITELIVLSTGKTDASGLSRPHDPRHEVDDPWEARVRCHRCEKAYIAVEMDRDPSNEHRAICASCAQTSPTFVRQARREAAEY